MNLRLQIYLYQLRLLSIFCLLILGIYAILYQYIPDNTDYVIAFFLGSFVLNDLALYGMFVFLI
jgi:hypothetical protein